jgi:hypothetical protein
MDPRGIFTFVLIEVGPATDALLPCEMSTNLFNRIWLVRFIEVFRSVTVIYCYVVMLTIFSEVFVLPLQSVVVLDTLCLSVYRSLERRMPRDFL